MKYPDIPLATYDRGLSRLFPCAACMPYVWLNLYTGKLFTSYNLLQMNHRRHKRIVPNLHQEKRKRDESSAAKYPLPTKVADFVNEFKLSRFMPS